MPFHAEALNGSGYQYTSTPLDACFEDPDYQIYENSFADMTTVTYSQHMNINATAVLSPTHQTGPLSHTAPPGYPSGSFQPSHSFLSWSSESGASMRSVPSSSSVGSPTATGFGVRHFSDTWAIPNMDHGLEISSSHDIGFNPEFFEPDSFDYNGVSGNESYTGFINPFLATPTTPLAPTFALPRASPQVSPATPFFSHNPPKNSRSQSPYIHNTPWEPYPHDKTSRRRPVSSGLSLNSHRASRSPSADGEEDGREKKQCPIPECGGWFKDLKAHMLTHQAERPEKCPILSCPFNKRGFSRRYDKNRHTLTHYKGLMVCSFCPDSGTAAEKTVSRADAFKRHLTTKHGVEQNPPNSRKKSPAAIGRTTSDQIQNPTGKCPTCQDVFADAQAVYEHLDDCVLRIVQTADPGEAINERLLFSIAHDQNVKATMKRHGLLETLEGEGLMGDFSNEHLVELDEVDNYTTGTQSMLPGRKPTKAIGTSSMSTRSKLRRETYRTGLTYSKGGVKGRFIKPGRKKKRHYPPIWGLPSHNINMKKRVICCYDGQRRLVKDDMMLSSEFEVRMKLRDGQSYITDLDVQSLARAEGFHGATEEEKGPWIPDNIRGFDMEKLMA